MNGARLAAASTWLILVGTPVLADDPPPPSTTGPRALGLFSPLLAQEMREQALDALARDARFREMRFLDADQPGFLFASTRVGQTDINHGRYTTQDLFDIGGLLFHLPLASQEGYGAADLPKIGRVHRGRRGGPDARSCSDCHWKGGPAGAGGATDNGYFDGDGDSTSSALVRNPIALQGTGLLELLAAEMTSELLAKKGAATAEAGKNEKDVSVALFTKGVSFGTLVVSPDGTVDTKEVVGIDDSLIVKPFGWKGSFAKLGDIVEESLLVHHGMQSERIEREGAPWRAGSGAEPDRDGDGVTREITEGQLSALTLYVAMQPVPQSRVSVDPDTVLLWGRGRTLMEATGCTSCHVSSLPLSNAVYASGDMRVDLASEGAQPRLEVDRTSGQLRVFAFSDLKRHDLGEGLAEAREDRGVDASVFLTAPLWGLARSGPYLHDGRAPTTEAAILAHGGEASESREKFLALNRRDQGALRTFLASLTRARRMIPR